MQSATGVTQFKSVINYLAFDIDQTIHAVRCSADDRKQLSIFISGESMAIHIGKLNDNIACIQFRPERYAARKTMCECVVSAIEPFETPVKCAGSLALHGH